MAILESLTISCDEDDNDVNRVGRIKAIVLLHAIMASAECRLVIHLLLPPEEMKVFCSGVDNCME